MKKIHFALVFSLLCASEGVAREGTVQRVAGELAYVAGLNGLAPVWANLTVQNGRVEGARLEVIKELPELVVARIVAEDNAGVKPGDVVVVSGTRGTARRAKRVVHAMRVDERPEVDGVLDDPAWARARPITGFVQRDPNYWMPSAEQTVARIVYTDKSIYFGFECFVPDSSRFIANNMRRDSEIYGDDNVQILLDTYNDRQNGFFFFVNPLGAQSDLMLSNEGRTYNRDWDCNWTARTKHHPDRWIVEVEIPFSQLRFKQSDDITWGINLSRYNARKNQAAQLVVGQRSSSSTERYRMADIGELQGLKDIRARRPILVKPYALPGTAIDDQATDPGENAAFEIGSDLRYGITSNISLDLSYNTDFAQVEADQEQTNLTQFRLFFPEKREFFLEGANLFQFGEQARLSGSGTRPPTLLFYSRRIGLEEKTKIPILVGTKIAGKEGRTSIGALNALTDAKTFLDEDGDTVRVPRTNYSVIRVRRDVFARSNVGFIAVNKQVDDLAGGWNRYNRAGGIDFNYSPTPNLNFQAFAARTWDSELGVADDARFASMNYRGTMYWARLKFLDVEDRFEPAVGFINRRSGLDGFRRYDIYARYRPRPNFGNIRYISMGPEAQVFTDRDNDVKYWTAELSIFAMFNTGDYWRFELTRTRDVVDETFYPSDRRDDLGIPPGTYTFTSFATGPRPSRARKLRPGISFEAGTYYTGKRYTLRSESSFRPSGRLTFEAEYQGDWIRLPQGNLNLHTLSNRLQYSFSTDFFVKLFVQWNNDKAFASANFLLNYRYRPGSDIFVVFDSAYDTNAGLTRKNRSVLVKLSYLLSL